MCLMFPVLLHTTSNLSSVINHKYFTSFGFDSGSCDRDPNSPFVLVGAAAFFAGPFRGEGRSEKEADRSHRAGPPVRRGPVECHPERIAKGDRAR